MRCFGIHNPVFEAQPWHFLEVSDIARQQRSSIGWGNTGDSEVHRANADPLLLEVLHHRRR